MTTLTTGLQELTADEIDSVAGALTIHVNIGIAKAYLTLNEGVIGGGVKVAGGEWKSGAIWADDLPKPK